MSWGLKYGSSRQILYVMLLSLLIYALVALVYAEGTNPYDFLSCNGVTDGSTSIACKCPDDHCLNGDFYDYPNSGEMACGTDECICEPYITQNSEMCFQQSGPQLILMDAPAPSCQIISVAANLVSGYNVQCPSGYVVTGGGFQDNSYTSYDQKASYPLNNGWY